MQELNSAGDSQTLSSLCVRCAPIKQLHTLSTGPNHTYQVEGMMQELNSAGDSQTLSSLCVRNLRVQTFLSCEKNEPSRDL
ncbi:hypothetical protein RRG08_046022 [Elysia crispata]|uniref:Uncharacterized protein n=1 Tax=Elysia crispata TaxID=231223 RepID=A0AAE1DDP1_9GAST|nr:hypothetical protein RRG08_046022 [Elysia crispata]